MDGLFSPEKIENPPAEDTEEVIADAFMALLASYNLQFEGFPFLKSTLALEIIRRTFLYSIQV
jgi:hypothetical protein